MRLERKMWVKKIFLTEASRVIKQMRSLQVVLSILRRTLAYVAMRV